MLVAVLLLAMATALHCDEAQELRSRAKENQLLATALADVSRCSTLRCTVDVERRVDEVKRDIEALRLERSRLHCEFGPSTTSKTSSPASTAPPAPVVRQGCMDLSEVELRRRESSALAGLLRESSTCKTLECVLKTERAIKKLKQTSREERHKRNLKCASKQPGIAVVGTKKGEKKESLVCALHAEGICLDIDKKLTRDEAEQSCDALRDRYDVPRGAFREGEKCKHEGAIGVCRKAAALHEQGDIAFFAPMTVSRARQHCKDAQGSFAATSGTNWSTEFRREAKEVAWGEVESYKAFAALFGRAVGLAPVASNATAVGGSARNAGQPDTTSGNGSQTLRILGAVFLCVFVILFTIAAALLYWKSSVESSHKRRRVGEGYVRITTAKDGTDEIEEDD